MSAEVHIRKQTKCLQNEAVRCGGDAGSLSGASDCPVVHFQSRNDECQHSWHIVNVFQVVQSGESGWSKSPTEVLLVAVLERVTNQPKCVLRTCRN